MNKFLFAENEMAKNNTPAIIHMLDPISIILIEEGHVNHERPHKHFTHIGLDGATEHFTLIVHHLFSTKFVSDDEIPAIVDKLLTKAWHWYASYLNWQDINYPLNN